MHSTGWFFGTDAAWSFRSIWYGRPCHSAALLQDNLRHHWHCASLDNFLPPWEKAVCQLQRIQINSVIVTVWSCTRIGSWTDPLPSVQIYSRLIDGTEQHSHGSVDNTQIYGSCAAPALQQRILTCVVSMLEWMQSNRLQLNATKTEQLRCTPPWQQEYLPNIPLLVGSDMVQTVRCVRNLGIYIESDLSTRSHVSKAVSNCFAALCRLWSIHRLVTQPILLSLVMLLIMTWLDYGSVTLAGLPGDPVDCLQSMLNAAARLVCCAQKYDHVTHLLWDLHWLRFWKKYNFDWPLFFCCHSKMAPHTSSAIFNGLI